MIEGVLYTLSRSARASLYFPMFPTFQLTETSEDFRQRQPAHAPTGVEEGDGDGDDGGSLSGLSPSFLSTSGGYRRGFGVKGPNMTRGGGVNSLFEIL